MVVYIHYRLIYQQWGVHGFKANKWIKTHKTFDYNGVFKK